MAVLELSVVRSLGELLISYCCRDFYAGGRQQAVASWLAIKPFLMHRVKYPWLFFLVREAVTQPHPGWGVLGDP